MEELHNHTGNADKFKTTLDDDASIYQQRETKSGREQMASLHGKAKAAFFMEYYSKTILVIVVVAVVLIQFIYNYVKSKDYALNILAVNTYGEANEEFEEEYLTDFMERNEIDTSKYEIGVNCSLTISTDSMDTTSVYSTQTIVTLFAAGEVDIFLADSDYFMSLAENGYFNNLEAYLTEEELASLEEDRLVYVTIEPDEEEEDAEDSGAGQTILAGISVPPDEGWLGEAGWYPESVDVLIGIGASVKDEELAVSLLKEILFYE